MSELVYRPMRDEDQWPIAQVMSISGNYWNETHGLGKAFPAGPKLAVFQFDVYKKLEVENLGYVAIDEETGMMAGLSFMHDRPTHVSLGTLNIHPNWFGTRRRTRAGRPHHPVRGIPRQAVAIDLQRDQYRLLRAL